MNIRYFSLPKGKLFDMPVPKHHIRKCDMKYFDSNNLQVSIERLNTNNLVYYVARKGEHDSEKELIHIANLDEKPIDSFKILRKLAKELI